MSRAIAVFHGAFGRATVYHLDRSLLSHAHREGHLIFHVGATAPALRLGDETRVIEHKIAGAINPWQPHSMPIADGGAGVICLVLYIRQEWFQHLSENSKQQAMRFGRSFIELTDNARAQVDRVAAELLESNHGTQCEQFERVLFELTQSCFDLSWHAVPEPRTPLAISRLCRDSRISRSLNLMAERIDMGDDFVLEGIARAAGLSRPHFFKLFREQLGLTPNIYLNTLRMEHAIERLTDSQDQITSIGLDLGFSCQASFSRFFVTNVGIAPSDYRRVAYTLRTNSDHFTPSSTAASHRFVA